MKEKIKTIHKLKILIIEDDQFLCEIFKGVFENNSFEVIILNSANNIIEKAIEYKPDIISMGIVLPDINGYEATKLLKQNQATKNIPVIGFDNLSKKDALPMALSAGMENYFVFTEVKPQEYVGIIKGYLNTLILKVTHRRGVYVLVRKLPSGADNYITFTFNNKGKKIGMPTKSSDLAIFNELMFANWFLVSCVDKSNSSANSPFLILVILDQARWDFVRNKLLADGITTAVLNPCEAKDHQCPIYRFKLKDESDFNKLKEWFSKCPNGHYTFKGQKKGSTLLLLEKPIINKNDDSISLEKYARKN